MKYTLLVVPPGIEWARNSRENVAIIDSDSPFMAFQVGDFIAPVGFSDSGDCKLSDRWRITKVEHFVSNLGAEPSHSIQIYCEEFHAAGGEGA